MWSLMAFTLFTFQRVFSETCPPLESITPCSCITLRNTINVRCTQLKSLKEMQNSVQGFTGRNIFLFAIEKSTFEYIPHDLFEHVKIKELQISESNFSSIGTLGNPQFKGLETSLETLKFTKTFSRKNPLPFLSMENLTRLTFLEFYDTHVEVVHNHWFDKGPKSLKVVRFIRCNLRAVGHNAFNSLTNLNVIDLSDNKLTFIPRWALPEPAPYLQELNLERNKFETLPEDMFTNMPNLKRVKLELNEFSTIGQRIWEPAWKNLELLNIDYNPMICDKNIKWIYDYDSNEDLEKKLIATCYKPFILMERDLHSLTPEEIK